MSYKEEILSYINAYENGLITFEDCIIECVNVLNRLKEYYNSPLFSIYHNEKDILKYMNKARLYVLIELIKVIGENI